eukprot:scaffold34685_cov183-Amphora_coffeaeformis.AAC.17
MGEIGSHEASFYFFSIVSDDDVDLYTPLLTMSLLVVRWGRVRRRLLKKWACPDPPPLTHSSHQ